MHLRPGRLGVALGFTLLELLVVMALMSLLAGLVGSATMRTLEAAEMRSLHRRLVAIVEALPLAAYRSGSPLVLEASAIQARLGKETAHVRVRLDRPLAYSAEGVARGGQLSLLEPGGFERRWVVHPVSGKVEPVAP